MHRTMVVNQRVTSLFGNAPLFRTSSADTYYLHLYIDYCSFVFVYLVKLFDSFKVSPNLIVYFEFVTVWEFIVFIIKHL